MVRVALKARQTLLEPNGRRLRAHAALFVNGLRAMEGHDFRSGSESMPRQTAEPEKLARLDEALRDMFRALQAQPTPSRLLSFIDQLEEESEEARPNALGHFG